MILETPDLLRSSILEKREERGDIKVDPAQRKKLFDESEETLNALAGGVQNLQGFIKVRGN